MYVYMYMYVYICICMCIYIYIYIYNHHGVSRSLQAGAILRDVLARKLAFENKGALRCAAAESIIAIGTV